MAIELSDDVLSAIVPVIVYWVFSGIYGLLGYFEDCRLHPKAEEDEKNIASKGSVLKGVLLQQAVQISVVLLILKTIGDESGKAKAQPSLSIIAVQFVIAMIVLDTWQYFGHRYMHINKYLYKHVHATHHALVVPYAWGALYNNPLEGLILDTIGGALAFLFSGMTARTSIFFFSLATIKALDVHCGLYFPRNPLQAIFANNCAYHDVHHQLKGNKHNFSAPFFISWDKILGTHMPFTVERRKEGGFEAKPSDTTQTVTLELAKRDHEKGNGSSPDGDETMKVWRGRRTRQQPAWARDYTL